MSVLSDEQRAEIDHWLAKYPQTPEGRQSAVIPALHVAQEGNGGWLEREHVDAVADYIGMSRTTAYEVATFYSMFHLERNRSRHKVSICNNISCWLCGGDEMVAYAQEKLGVPLGGTTEDGRITLVQEEECLAACAGAPMMIVDGHYYTELTREKIDRILDSLD